MENGDPQHARRSRILFLDAYDSFTNNIVSLLTELLDVQVCVRRMDLSPFPPERGPSWTREELVDRLAGFDAVVCGPGPGSPLNPDDVGAFRTLWDLASAEAVPVLGVCLGFQSLVCHNGGEIRKLRRGLHGMVRDIEYESRDIFSGVRPFKATLYHSLCADLGQDAVPASEWPLQQYRPFAGAPDLIPLAWSRGHVDEGEDERILMAVKHARRPFWGLQYHPESICTHPEAHDVLRNWWAEAQRWNAVSRMSPLHSLAESESGEVETPTHTDQYNKLSQQYGQTSCELFNTTNAGPQYYSFVKLNIPQDLTAVEVAEALGEGKDDTIVLDSSSASKGDPLALYSIIALEADKAPRLKHRAGERFVTLYSPSQQSGLSAQEERIGYLDSAPGEFSPWQVFSKFWSERRLDVSNLPAGLPDVFKGGLIGYVSYESGLDALSPGVLPTERGHRRPDICLAWVTRSVVLDHRANAAYIRTVSNDPSAGQDYCKVVADKLRGAPCMSNQGVYNQAHRNGVDQWQQCPGEVFQYQLPNAATYQDKVRRCQDSIKEGNSYELCLTDQTFITRARGDDVPPHVNTKGATLNRATPWDIFKRLRSRQPAPFGSFVKLGGATLISSSPERFLQHTSEGLCAMRPMKGTVRKSDQVSTLSQAEEILHIPKEEAENLMIVDLVRHDLHGICGAGKVTVPELLKVEEYATVFQMVTNVQGQLNAGREAAKHRRKSEFNGLDVLSSVLPPGSMTGAPKKRSCEILYGLEKGIERSLYSGVVGYMDAAGRGDWSVTIRAMFRWDDELAPPAEGETEKREVWHIGAGGAVTILSTPEGEHDEMVTKLSGPLGIWKAME
jgi:para-aminobenzoate synthetase